jgi:HlyD family secretion protein
MLIQTMNSIKNLSTEKETLERHISDLDRNIKNATIYAPISGRINEIRNLNIGDYALPGEQILNIIPTDATMLKAELYVDPAYIARVKIGQKVSLRFPGLPPSKYGKLEAEINIIPADYIIGSNSKPSFVVEANINKPYLITRNGEQIMLRAGIGAEGRIIIAQDKIINMFLKKLDFISSSMDTIDDI